MSLPKFHVPRETVEIEGELVEIRGLTRAEAAKCQKMVEANTPWSELEIVVIGYGTDTPTEEVRDWYANTASHVVDVLVGAIKDLSRLDEGASKSGGESNRPGDG